MITRNKRMKVYIVISILSKKIIGVYKTKDYPLEILDNFVAQKYKDHFRIEEHEVIK